MEDAGNVNWCWTDWVINGSIDWKYRKQLQTLNRRFAAFEYAKGYNVNVSLHAVSYRGCRNMGEMAEHTLFNEVKRECYTNSFISERKVWRQTFFITIFYESLCRENAHVVCSTG